MKKLTHQFWMWIAGIIVLGAVAVAGFSQGVFFQGNLRFAAETPKGSTLRPESSTFLQILPTSNQLRSGANSLFKIIVRNPKESTLKRMKLNLALHDLGINNVKVVLNGDRDITEQLTAETQNLLNSTLNAPNRSIDKTFVLAFRDNFKLPPGENSFEILFNTNFFSNQSVLIGGLLDVIMNVENVENVVEGPVEKIQLESTYSTL